MSLKTHGILTAFLLLGTAGVFADDQVTAAIAAFETCAFAKAEAFAALDGSLSEVATAAIGACDLEAGALRAEYQNYENSQPPAGSHKAGRGQMFVDMTIEDITPRLMATIAEARS